MSVRTLTLNDDPEQVLQDLNAAFDGTTQTDLNAGKIAGKNAGNSANNILVLDSNGLIPLANIPNELTGKNAATATNTILANEAKGDTRFQLCGSGNGGTTSLTAGTITPIYTMRVFIPTGKSLVLKRVRFSMCYSDFRFQLSVSEGGETWLSATSSGEETPNTVLTSVSNTAVLLRGYAKNVSASTQSLPVQNHWWLDLSIE
jgi:hypothetical protein